MYSQFRFNIIYKIHSRTCGMTNSSDAGLLTGLTQVTFSLFSSKIIHPNTLIDYPLLLIQYYLDDDLKSN